MPRSLTALALVLGLAAFNAAHAAAPIQGCIGTPTAGAIAQQTCGTTQAVAANNAIIGQVTYYSNVSNVLSSVTDDQANTYTVLDTIGPHFGGGWYTADFVSYNLTNGPKTVKANFSGAGASNSQVLWSEYPGVGSTDVHTAQYLPNVGTLAGQVLSGAVTTTNAADTIWGMVTTAAEVVEDTPVNVGNETGATARLQDTTHNGTGGGVVTSDFSAPAGSVQAAFTSSVSDTQAAFVVAMKPLAIPKTLSCTPATNLLDTSAVNTVVCTPSVTMTDGSAFSGTLAVSPTNLFKIAGGNAELSAVPGAVNDGTVKMTLSATQNGSTLTPPAFNVTINSASVSGTPFTFGWKNIDPGAGADGPGIVTMPHTGTIQEIAVRVVVPATAPALFDIYHAAPGQACSAGSQIHSGDFDASLPADNLQLVTGSNVLNSSLAVGDTLCVVTKPGFPTTGEVSLTVTVL